MPVLVSEAITSGVDSCRWNGRLQTPGRAARLSECVHYRSLFMVVVVTVGEFRRIGDTVKDNHEARTFWFVS